ncbi:MAG: hypothetical protein HRU29_01225 [Rhizobiales bacterium]|nr:DUF4344 domain-containing metallopeptidase [Hyphomicrobiales bacterium]NRB12994.1 hypothetical protein [Hyphomicrobiales bacterium]
MFKKFIAILIASFMFVQPSQAAEDIVLTDEEYEQLVQFVNGNVIWTMFHETGHALVTLHEIPILAKEEDAVDNLATIIMLVEESEQFNEYLKESAYVWFLMDEFAAKSGEELNFADEHSLDQQRAFQIVCFLYGASPEKFEKFATLMQMPEERLANCGYDFSVTYTNWLKVISGFAMQEGDVNQEISIVYHEATPALQGYQAFMQSNQILEQIQQYIAVNFKLPEPISLEAQVCDTPNAYWDPQTKQVIMCYELLAEFERLFMFDIEQAIAEEAAGNS